jgi:hypothetical protein
MNPGPANSVSSGTHLERTRLAGNDAYFSLILT